MKPLSIFLNVYGVISAVLFGGLFVLTATSAPIIQDGGALAFMRWQPHSPDVELMLEGVYFVWAVFFFVAARRPLAYLSFIDFTIWANALHGLIMAVQALVMPMYLYKFFTDIAWCLVLAAGLAILRPRGARTDQITVPS
jgi:hypothetical protein